MTGLVDERPERADAERMLRAFGDEAIDKCLTSASTWEDGNLSLSGSMPRSLSEITLTQTLAQRAARADYYFQLALLIEELEASA